MLLDFTSKFYFPSDVYFANCQNPIVLKNQFKGLFKIAGFIFRKLFKGELQSQNYFLIYERKYVEMWITLDIFGEFCPVLKL